MREPGIINHPNDTMATNGTSDAAATPARTTDERIGDLMQSNHELMGVIKETIIAMQKMQQDNMAIQQEMLSSFARQNKGPEGSSGQGSPRTTHPVQNDGNSLNSTQDVRHRSSKAKPSRPTIESDLDEMSWEIFLDNFSRYKKMANLQTNEEICMELREACSKDVNKSLYQYIGVTDLNADNLTEAKLLEHIKSVAVKPIHPEVHRWNFNGLAQNEGEPIAQFVGRLKGEAALCRFTVKCSCDREVSYAEEMISQRMICGLVNTEHQSKLLSEAKDLDTLLKKVQRITSLETTDEAQNQIRNQSKVNAIRSQYRKQQKSKATGGFPPRRKNFPSHKKFPWKCRGCGKTDHGPKKTRNRSDCTALGHECKSCGKQNHFESVCEARKSHVSFARHNDGETSDGDSCYDDDADYEYSEDSDVDDTNPADENISSIAANRLDFRHAKPPNHSS